MKFDNKSSIGTSDCIVIPTNNSTIPKSVRELLPDNIQKNLKSLLNRKNFTGKKLETFELAGTYKSTLVRIFIIGTGDQEKYSQELFRNIGNKIAKSCEGSKLKDVSVAAYKLEDELITAMVEGLVLGSYKFDKYLTKQEKKQHKIRRFNILSSEKSTVLLKACKKTEFISKTMNSVRDMVNAPAIDMTPTRMSEIAKEIAGSSSNIKVKVLGKKDIVKNKMGLIMGVTSGSNQECKLIVMEYKNKPKNKKPILLVGKGVTFDAGGLNLKLNSSIDGMKMDMAGGATVLNAFALLAKLDLPLHVIGIVPAVENLVGGDAYKPDDIITAYNGKTVEITNTDAEGRLILADSLAYGIKKFKPECVVDLATLTGACIAALGYTRTGLISNDKKLRNKLLKAAKSSGNKAWPLPIDDYHREKVNGDISDYKNYVGGVGAGATMGAAFLEKFVENTPWAHLDIAGVAFINSPIGYKPKGATGEPLKMIYHFLRDY